jgi:hypothetical protein
VLYDRPAWNALVRYFRVDAVVHRGELAVGPAFSLGGGPQAVKLQLGGTTDREVMLGATLLGVGA